MRKDYKRDGWKRHHEQSLEFEEHEDESPEAITLSIAGPKSEDDKWELLPMTPLKVRNFPPCLLTGIVFLVLTDLLVAIDQKVEGGSHEEEVSSSSLPAGHQMERRGQAQTSRCIS